MRCGCKILQLQKIYMFSCTIKTFLPWYQPYKLFLHGVYKLLLRFSITTEVTTEGIWKDNVNLNQNVFRLLLCPESYFWQRYDCTLSLMQSSEHTGHLSGGQLSFSVRFFFVSIIYFTICLGVQLLYSK